MRTEIQYQIQQKSVSYLSYEQIAKCPGVYRPYYQNDDIHFCNILIINIDNVLFYIESPYSTRLAKADPCWVKYKYLPFEGQLTIKLTND